MARGTCSALVVSKNEDCIRLRFTSPMRYFSETQKTPLLPASMHTILKTISKRQSNLDRNHNRNHDCKQNNNYVYLSFLSVCVSGAYSLSRCVNSATLFMQQMQHRSASLGWSVVAQVILFGRISRRSMPTWVHTTPTYDVTPNSLTKFLYSSSDNMPS